MPSSNSPRVKVFSTTYIGVHTEPFMINPPKSE